MALLAPSAANASTRRRSRMMSGVVMMAMLSSGCATGQLQVGRASDMVTAGRAVTGQATSIIDDSFQSHRRFVTELAAIDPDCELPNPRIALGPRAWGGCVPGADPGKAATLSGPSRAYAKLTLASIDGAVAYLDAVDVIATRKPIDIAGDLETARSELSGAIDAVNAVTNSTFELPVSADQLGAAKTLLDLLSDLISVSRQVRDLKKVEASLDRGEFDTSIEQLRGMTGRWTDALVLSIENENRQVDGIRALQRNAFEAATRASCGPKSPVDCPFGAVTPAARAEYRYYADRKLALLERKAQVIALGAQFDKLLVRFVKAHADYRQLLFDPANTKVTAAERKRRAQIIRGQIMSAIKGVLAIVALF